MQVGIKNLDNYIKYIYESALAKIGEVAEWSKANDSKSFNS